MKRSIALVLSCLLAAAASAQQTMEQKVTQGYQKAKMLSRIKLSKSYSEGDVESVDEILTQEPSLANMTIQDKDGQIIPLVYDACFTPRKPIAAPKELSEKIEKAERKYERLDRRNTRIRDRWNFYDDMVTDYKHPWKKIIFAAPEGIADLKDSHMTDRMVKLGKKIRALRKALQKLQLKAIYDDNPMLAVCYAHGTECEQCLKESFKPGKLTPSEELTLASQLPIYGASVEEIMKLEDWHNWVKIAKEIRVTP